MKLVLAYTPFLDTPGSQAVDLSMPPIGIGYLAGFVGHHGYECDLLDLNIEYIQFLADSNTLEISSLLKEVQTEKAYDPELVAKFTAALRLESVRLSKLVVDSLHRLSNGDYSVINESIVGQFIRRTVDKLSQYDVIGFSCIFSKQWYMTKAIILALKSVHPNKEILLGGPGVPEINNLDQQMKDIVSLIVPAEGEGPLLDYLMKQHPLKNANKGTVSISADSSKYWRDMDVLAVPDYKSLFDKYDYFSPERIIPLAISRGCYWSKCEFCGYGFGDWAAGLCTAPYRRQTNATIIDTIKVLREQLDTKYFYFSSDLVDPSLLRKLAHALIDNGVKIYWYSTIKLEKLFMEEGFIELLAKSGCKTLNFGLESTSQRILDAMNKGIVADDIVPFIENCQKNNIYVRTTSFIGYPTETPIEAVETCGTLYKISQSMPASPPGQFMPDKNSIISRKTQLGESCGLHFIAHDKGKVKVNKDGMNWAATYRQWWIAVANFYLNPRNLSLPLTAGNGLSFLWACKYSPQELRNTLHEARKKDLLVIMPYFLEAWPYTWFYINQAGGTVRYTDVVDALPSTLEIRQILNSGNVMLSLLNYFNQVISKVIELSCLDEEKCKTVREVCRLDYYLTASAISSGLVAVKVDQTGALQHDRSKNISYREIVFDIDISKAYAFQPIHSIPIKTVSADFGVSGLYVNGKIINSHSQDPVIGVPN